MARPDPIPVMERFHENHRYATWNRGITLKSVQLLAKELYSGKKNANRKDFIDRIHCFFTGCKGWPGGPSKNYNPKWLTYAYNALKKQAGGEWPSPAVAQE